jgi:prevent-host-death family protein
VPTYSTYEAKARLSEILRGVRRGQRAVIAHRGTPIAEVRPLPKQETLAEC